MTRKKRHALIRRAVIAQRKIATLKGAYSALDSAIQEMIDAGFQGDVTGLGYRLSLVDNFADKNCVFRAKVFRRFDLVVEKDAKRKKKK